MVVQMILYQRNCFLYICRDYWFWNFECFPKVFNCLCFQLQITPDIQIPHGIDGRPTGEAYITFASRIEAERAVAERMRKPFGNRYVEMLIAQ
jgi:hypothetical protein